MSIYLDNKHKIQNIASVSSFKQLLNQTTLSDSDKKIMCLRYVHHKDYRYIGDTLGYSESTVKRRHKKALMKISKML